MKRNNDSLVKLRTTLIFLTVTIVFFVWPISGICDEREVLKIDNKFLSKYLPNLKNPRLMTAKDISDNDEKESYREDGWTFVVTGDFNQDGHTDYAVVGKYDDPVKVGCIFVAIFSQRDKGITLEFINKSGPSDVDRAFLSVQKVGKVTHPRYEDEKYDVILVAFSLWSDNMIEIEWDGKKYIIMKQPDY